MSYRPSRGLGHPFIILTCLLSAAVLSLASTRAPAPVHNDSARAMELIADVNALRASNGLPPYEVDPILMAVAASQNDWRVSAGVTTHTGPNGSSPKQRAIAAGYGAGGTVFISENIWDGTGLTPAEAVQNWTGDAPHLNTMLGPNYRQVGAGAGESGGIWRYTLDAGYVIGGSYSPGQAPANGVVVAPAAVPVQKATAMPDGSVIHEVQTGQTLWTIAAVYGVDLATLLQLNSLAPGAFLHTGDKIVVKASWTPTASPAPSATSTPPPTATASPYPTWTPAPPTPTLRPTPSVRLPQLNISSHSTSFYLIVAGGLLIALGGIMATRRRR